ncbi:hypothetical protein DKL61_06030 [Gammaproteobacteria bacterium ESL0073]|nr:hypothetical protein DKL61_06030 [Gammaproteobacteria bacterium ESL0073]
MARYKVYQNDIGTIAFINRGWSIVFILSVYLLWGGVISVLPVIWNSLNIWESMTNSYVYYPILTIVLLISLYFAYKINRLLIAIRTKWLIKKGFVFTKEVNAHSAKQVADSLFSSYRFERPDMGCVGILGSAFIFLLFIGATSMGVYFGLNKLIIPSDVIQAKVTQTSYNPSREKGMLSYYDLNVVYSYSGNVSYSNVQSLSPYTVGDMIPLRYFKKNASMINVWNPSADGLLVSNMILLFYLLTLLALMMVYHRKVYAIADN